MQTDMFFFVKYNVTSDSHRHLKHDALLSAWIVLTRLNKPIINVDISIKADVGDFV